MRGNPYIQAAVQAEEVARSHKPAVTELPEPLPSGGGAFLEALSIPGANVRARILCARAHAMNNAGLLLLLQRLEKDKAKELAMLTARGIHQNTLDMVSKSYNKMPLAIVRRVLKQRGVPS